MRLSHNGIKIDYNTHTHSFYSTKYRTDIPDPELSALVQNKLDVSAEGVINGTDVEEERTGKKASVCFQCVD